MSGDSWIKAQQDNSDLTLAKRERIDFSGTCKQFGHKYSGDDDYCIMCGVGPD